MPAMRGVKHSSENNSRISLAENVKQSYEMTTVILLVTHTAIGSQSNHRIGIILEGCINVGTICICDSKPSSVLDTGWVLGTLDLRRWDSP
nr:hypothetical protein L204_05318 [Cryptococcus depauperatus CBS 7855]